MEPPMRKPKQSDRRQLQQRKPSDLSRCLAPLDVDHTRIAVVELSLSSWLQALHDDRLMLKKDILPAIGRMKIEEITKRDVVCIADCILERGARV
jgi:hypothetical protein